MDYLEVYQYYSSLPDEVKATTIARDVIIFLILLFSAYIIERIIDIYRKQKRRKNLTIIKNRNKKNMFKNK